MSACVSMVMDHSLPNGCRSYQDLLKQVDLEKEIAELKEELKTATGQKRVKAIRRLDVLDAFTSLETNLNG